MRTALRGDVNEQVIDMPIGTGGHAILWPRSLPDLDFRRDYFPTCFYARRNSTFRG
jgi:hypothetical protein